MVEPDEIKGSFDSGDPNTTNLYLGNLNPKVIYKICLFVKTHYMWLLPLVYIIHFITSLEIYIVFRLLRLN